MTRVEEFSLRPIQVDRKALNMDQVQQYDPPPNPAKITDSRASAYIAEFGDESWELDALEPRVIADLIRESVIDIRDEGRWTAQVDRETQAREQLTQVSEQWETIIENL